jgi:Zn ribbon nucleic-acid-binding protein
MGPAAWEENQLEVADCGAPLQRWESPDAMREELRMNDQAAIGIT